MPQHMPSSSRNASTPSRWPNLRPEQTISVDVHVAVAGEARNLEPAAHLAGLKALDELDQRMVFHATLQRAARVAAAPEERFDPAPTALPDGTA